MGAMSSTLERSLEDQQQQQQPDPPMAMTAMLSDMPDSCTSQQQQQEEEQSSTANDLEEHLEEDDDEEEEDDDDDEEEDLDDDDDDETDDEFEKQIEEAFDCRPGVKNLRLDIHYMTFLGRLMKDFPKIAVARLEEVARENYLLREDKEEMRRLTDDLQQEAKGYRVTPYLPHINQDPRVERRAKIAIDTFQKMLTWPAKLEGLPGVEDSIESVDVIDHRELHMLFEAKKKALREAGRPDGEIMLFHGTGRGNMDSIMTNNFDLSKGRRKAFGEGIYLSELPSTSLAYGTCLFLCRVLTGTIQTEGTTFDPLLFDSFSHWLEKGKGNFVIKESGQILPYCIVKIKPEFLKQMNEYYARKP